MERVIKNKIGLECRCKSCSNNTYDTNKCKSPSIVIDEQGKCLIYKRRYYR